MRAAISLLLLLAVSAPTAWGKGDDAIATEVTVLTPACLDLMNQVMDSYWNAVPPYTAGGCNTTCLQNCGQIVLDGIYALYHQDCPLQSDLTYCFNRFPSTWVQYANLCGLFVYTNSTAEAEAEATTVGAPLDYNASREVAWTAPSVFEINLRRLMNLDSAESESEAGGAGCFPAFYDSDSFRVWMSGDYWTEEYSAPSNAGGITVSVIFWISLVVLGFSTRA